MKTQASSERQFGWEIATGSFTGLRTKVIVNPKAGAGSTARKWPLVNRLLQRTGLFYEYEFTQRPGHAVELARLAADRGYDCVVSVGGDGTTNEIANGLYQAGALMNVVLGIISTGTGGDYIRTLGIPRDYKESCVRLIGLKKKVVDIGLVECMNDGQLIKRVFVNFVGLGLDSEITKATSQTFKKMGSKPSYLLGACTSLLMHRNKNVNLILDGCPDNGSMADVLICNGRYGGGSMMTAPDADVTDGLLDVIVVHDASKTELVLSLPRIYKGTHLSHPKVSIHRVKEIEISSSQGLLVQMDGEVVGEAPAKIRIIPGALIVAV